MLASQRHEATILLDAAVARPDDVLDPPAGVWLIVQTPAGTAASPGLLAGLPANAALRRTAADGAPETAEVRIGEVEYRIETRRRPDATVVQAVFDLRANHTERDQLITTLITLGGSGCSSLPRPGHGSGTGRCDRSQRR